MAMRSGSKPAADASDERSVDGLLPLESATETALTKVNGDALARQSPEITAPPVVVVPGGSPIAARGKRVLERCLARVPQEHHAKIQQKVRKVYRYSSRGASIALNTQFDMLRYLRYSWALSDPTTPEQLQYFLRMRYHTFEKGLAMPEPRPGFGQGQLVNLLRALQRYERDVGYDDLVGVVVNVLTKYQEFNAVHGVVIARLDDTLEDLRARYPQMSMVSEGGTVQITKSEWLRNTSIDFESFAFSRRSVRNYADHPVALNLITNAVRIAQRAPSVCNRQAGRVHVFTEKASVDRVLSYQLGHRGFGHTVPCVMVITVDLQSYYKPGERFQGWVDGGLFAMSLIFGLHAQGLGTCCLNWNVTKSQDAPMRKGVGIPANEMVITMLAVGHIPDVLEVAESPRRPLSEVLLFRD